MQRASWGTQMCECAGLSPGEARCEGVKTFTESVPLHVRTNGRAPPAAQRGGGGGGEVGNNDEERIKAKVGKKGIGRLGGVGGEGVRKGGEEAVNSHFVLGGEKLEHRKRDQGTADRVPRKREREGEDGQQEMQGKDEEERGADSMERWEE